MPDKQPHPKLGTILLLGALTAYPAISIDLYLPSLPTISASLGASAGAAARTVSAFFLGMSLGQFIYGPLSDRYGRKPPLLIASGIYIAASIFCAFAPNIESLIGGRFIEAIGGCAGTVIPRAIVRDRYDHRETARIFSLLTLVMGVAPILAPFVGGAILTFATWRMLFVVLTVFGIAVGLATWFRLDESRPDAVALLARSETPFGAYRALFAQRRILGYTLAGALNGACFFTYISASPEIIIHHFNFPPQQFGWIFGINAVGLIGMSQVNRAVLKYYAPDQIVSVACLVVVAFAGLLTVCAETGTGGIFGVLGPLFLIVSTYAFVSANTSAGALSVDPARAGSISALVGGFGFGAGALASAVAGWLSDDTPRPVAWTMLVSSALAALTLYTMALPRGERLMASASSDR